MIMQEREKWRSGFGFALAASHGAQWIIQWLHDSQLPPCRTYTIHMGDLPIPSDVDAALVGARVGLEVLHMNALLIKMQEFGKRLKEVREEIRQAYEQDLREMDRIQSILEKEVREMDRFESLLDEWIEMVVQ